MNIERGGAGCIFVWSKFYMYRIRPTNFVTRFLNIGVTPDLPFKELQKTYLFNLFVLLAIPIVPVFFVRNLIEGNTGLATLNFFQIILYIVCLYISITRKWLQFRSLLIWLSSIIYFIGGHYFNNGNEFLMFANLFAALVIFESTKHYFFYATISLTAFGFIQTEDFHYANWIETITARHTINMNVALIIVTILLQFFKKLHYAYENKLEEICDDLLSSKKEKERILKIVAHDLRSPISGISALSEMLMKDETDEKKKECLNMMHEASKQSIEFIGEVMQMESSSDIQIEIKEVDLNQMVEKIIQMHKNAIENKHLMVTLRFENCPPIVRLDAEKIERVINNLVHNAIKFSNKGGYIEISAKTFQTNQMQISVKDSGIGIPEKYQDHLFTTVGTSKRNGTAGEKSYGIGLVICKQIIEAHKGQISVLSQVGQGSTFSIILPLQSAA